MRTYTEECYVAGEWITVPVDVPTPIQFQARREYNYGGVPRRVLITNFCGFGREKYAVAMFTKDPTSSEFLKSQNLDWELQARPENVATFEGKSARKDAIHQAATFAVRGM